MAASCTVSGNRSDCAAWLQSQAPIELLSACSRASTLPGRPGAVEGRSMVTNVDNCRQLSSRSGPCPITWPQVTAADDQLWLN